MEVIEAVKRAIKPQIKQRDAHDDVHILEALSEGSVSEGTEHIHDVEQGAGSGSGMPAVARPEFSLCLASLSIHTLTQYGKVYKGLWQGTEVAVKTSILPANMSGVEKREKMVGGGACSAPSPWNCNC